MNQPTNLHTHGLHVSPAGNGDNPFVTAQAGTDFDYVIPIPADHPSGTFWYHPHHHGFVADQIFGGLAGALIVEGGPELGVASDRVMVVADITLDGSGRVAPVGAMDRMMGRQGELVLVNGQHQPVVAAAPSSAERWRVINACASRVLSLRLEGHRFTQVASDGHFLPAPAERDRIVLAPGNRADVVVLLGKPGQYRLLADPYDRGNPGMGGMIGNGRRRCPGASGHARRGGRLPSACRWAWAAAGWARHMRRREMSATGPTRRSGTRGSLIPAESTRQ